MTFAGAVPATEVISVAGSAVVTSRLTPRPMGAPACLLKARCPMLEPDARKPARPVLRGGGEGDLTSLPDVRHEVADVTAVR